MGTNAGAVLLAAPLPANAENMATMDDLKVTTSGLAWKDLSEGTGSVPVAGSTIRYPDMIYCHVLHESLRSACILLDGKGELISVVQLIQPETCLPM